jgi:hypothetical protein
MNNNRSQRGMKNIFSKYMFSVAARLDCNMLFRESLMFWRNIWLSSLGSNSKVSKEPEQAGSELKFLLISCLAYSLILEICSSETPGFL